ncbi:interference hedgehog-like isoform X2 [Aethina tumida]|uniref:interference hedgehog-like isoform X2 n=1 Tax=Aethina tumida TaxID=116153 RepID=UPI002148593C|nr:interference hedgehog-like isoform X2 [Aethina tumida]
MESSRDCQNVFLWVLVFLGGILADNEYMVSKPEQITLALTYETRLTCEMNIEPDKFEWKIYPTTDYYNPMADIHLNTSNFHVKPDFKELRSERHNRQRKKSYLTIKANNNDVAGDYQCLAYYGASVVANVPWRISIAKQNDFSYQPNAHAEVTEGNTVSWRCEPPDTNPEAYIDYYKGDQLIMPPFEEPKIKSLLLEKVRYEDSGQYKCTAAVNGIKYTSKATLTLKVHRHMENKEPSFIIKPKETYTVTKGSNVFLDCAAVGNPVPKVVWYKKNGPLPEDRIDMISGGLKIRNVTSSDDGVYVCNYTNPKGTVSHQITVIYNEAPSIDCPVTITDVRQGENLDLDCTVTGTPEPRITWFLNGYSVNDSSIEAIGNKIYIRPVDKKHAGNLQIFARNSVKTVYNTISVRVLPIPSSGSSAPVKSPSRHRKRPKKPQKGKGRTPEMIPPTKPIISRVNDESVMVRWSVPQNSGLPIQFFKVQFRELGQASSTEPHRGKGWKTLNADIPPTTYNYEVRDLKPEHIYKFRIAAVFSNNDNKPSNNSDKFHLKRLDFDDRNPLPVPILLDSETVNSTSIKIYWKLPDDVDPNAAIDGYYVKYLSSSKAGDYLSATIDGKNTSSYIISHLQPDMLYDIKLQSYNSGTASGFSDIMKGKTAAAPVNITTTVPPPIAPAAINETNLYIYIVIGVFLVALLVTSVVMLFVCRKWKKKKSLNDNNKTGVEDHHIQADGNDFVVGTKSLPRSNGVVSNNRITITANPLADAENKKFLDRNFSRIKT